MSFESEREKAERKARSFWDAADEKKRVVIRVTIAACVLLIIGIIAHCSG